MDNKELVLLAEKARLNAYTPYSGFKVGAALLAKSGKVYLGCNIENASYTPTNCAERTAFFKAISECDMEFEKIAIVGGKDEPSDFCAPCGVCRQVMAEFCDENFEIILGNSKSFKSLALKDLLPYSFTKKD
ncbi:MAG: cytidine deaminase, partial [Clostridia bacterium]|nr:cytidine deaminase [Clostridia bacterium]